MDKGSAIIETPKTEAHTGFYFFARKYVNYCIVIALLKIVQYINKIIIIRIIIVFTVIV